MNDFLESLAYDVQDFLKRWAYQTAGVIFSLALTYFVFAMIGRAASGLNFTPIFISEEFYSLISAWISVKAILASGILAGLSFCLQREIGRNY